MKLFKTDNTDKKMKISGIISGICLIMLITSCGGDIVGTAQNYSENQPPEIQDLTTDLREGDVLEPQMTVTLSVKAADPENDDLRYTFTSEDGSFFDQKNTEGIESIKFIVGSRIVPNQSVSVSVSVTDGHLNSAKKSFVIGTAKDGPTVLFHGEIPSMMKVDEKKKITFSVTGTGLYQIQMLPGGDTSFPVWDPGLPQRLCYAGERINVFIEGSSHNDSHNGIIPENASAVKIRMSGGGRRIAVLFRDGFDEVASNSFVLREDSTPPHMHEISPPELNVTKYISTESFMVNIRSRDNSDDGGTGSGSVRISYTTNGDEPDFRGKGNVVAMTDEGNGLYGASFPVGGTALGVFRLKYRFIDEYGNMSPVLIGNYQIAVNLDPPSAVVLAFENVSERTLDVKWTNPSDVDFEKIHLSWQGGGESGSADISGSPGSRKVYHVTGLKEGVEYTFTAESYDTSGFHSGSSARRSTLTLPPSAVVLAFDNVTERTLDVKWTNPSASDFARVHLSWQGGGDSGSTDVYGSPGSPGVYHVTGLKEGVEYTFTAESYDTSGFHSGSSARRSTLTLPPSAVILAFDNVTERTLDVKWTNPSASDFARVHLSWQGGGDSGSTDVYGSPGSPGVYHVTGLKEGVEYTFTAESYDTSGFHSGSSARRSTLTLPPSAVILAFDNVTERTLDVKWTNPSASDFARVHLSWQGGGDSGSADIYGSPGSPGVYHVTGLKEGVEYIFTAESYDTSGFYSISSDRITMPSIPPSAVVLAFENVTDTTLDVKWTNPSESDFVRVHLSWQGGGESGSADVYGSPGSPGAYHVTGLKEGVEYTFTAESYDALGLHSDSSGRITMQSIPPSAVVLAFENVTDTTLDVKWTNPSESDFVRVHLSWQGGGESGSADVSGSPGSAGAYHVTGLREGVEYTFTAVSYDGRGNYSGDSVSAVKTELIPPGKVGIVINSITSSSVTVRYTPPNDTDFDHMDIVFDGNRRTESAGFSDSYGGLNPDASYIITATAYDKAGTASEVKTAVIRTPPATLTAVLVSGEAGLLSIDPNDTGKCYILAGDITLSPEFPGIGDKDNTFKGVFYGGGHSVKGLVQSSGTKDYSGFFGFIEGALVKDLVIENPYIDGDDCTGAVAGYARDSEISNCTVILAGTDSSIKGSSFTGGIVGTALSCDIKGCRVEATGGAKITGRSGSVGGIMGSFIKNINYDPGSISDCTVSASIESLASGKTGGIAGSMLNTLNQSIVSIRGCSFTGSVRSVNTSYAGGIAGESTFVSILNCTANGEISAENYAGGIVGYMSGESGTEIFNCAFKGGTVLSGNSLSGGIAGHCEGADAGNRMVIKKSYSLGTVSASGTAVGGITGEGLYLTIDNCYSLAGLSGTEKIGGISGSGTNVAMKYSYFAGTISAGGSAFIDAVLGENISGSTASSVYYNGALTAYSLTGVTSLSFAEMNGSNTLMNGLNQNLSNGGDVTWTRNGGFPYFQ